jgi:antitoxin (DNA-binding transcriptional repressor) of toxin-antitoxin stability system
MSTVTIEEAQARLPDIMHQLTTGEEVVILERGQIVARLVGEQRLRPQRPGPGLCKGMVTLVADDDEHRRDFAEYMPT